MRKSLCLLLAAGVLSSSLLGDVVHAINIKSIRKICLEDIMSSSERNVTVDGKQYPAVEFSYYNQSSFRADELDFNFIVVYDFNEKEIKRFILSYNPTPNQKKEILSDLHFLPPYNYSEEEIHFDIDYIPGILLTEKEKLDIVDTIYSYRDEYLRLFFETILSVESETIRGNSNRETEKNETIKLYLFDFIRKKLNYLPKLSE